MEKRIIRIKTDTQSQLITVETSATTLGELKQEKTGINWKDTTVVVKETKTGLPFDESPLPAGNTLLFVFPKNSKSGKYVELSYREAKQAIKELKSQGVEIPFNYTRATTERLNEFLKAQGKTKKVKTETVVPSEKIVEDIEPLTLQAGRKYLLIIEGSNPVEVVKEIVVERVPEGYVDMRILIDTTTIDQLNDEYNSLKKKV
jgi:hypothetical protein